MAYVGRTPANAAITSADLDDSIVTASKIATNAVEEAKINANAVTSAKINDDSIVNADINSSAAIATTKLASNAITINGSAVALGGSVTIGETKPTVADVSQTIAPNTSETFNITGTNFISIPIVEFIKSDTGAITRAGAVSFTGATALSVTATIANGSYYVRVENNDGNAGRSTNAIITASTAPTWTTSAGSLGSIAGDFSGTVATVAATSDSSITYSEVSSPAILIGSGSGQANCTLDGSTGVISTTDFGGSSTTATLYTFTLRATDAEGQTADRVFTLTSQFYTGSTGGGQFN